MRTEWQDEDIDENPTKPRNLNGDAPGDHDDIDFAYCSTEDQEIPDFPDAGQSYDE